MFKIFNKIFDKKVTVQKYKPLFTTVDDKTHEGLVSKWVITDRLSCTVPEYLMIDIKSDGYMLDINKIMYPLQNIKSIKWELLDEKSVPDKFSSYQIFVKKRELRKLEETLK